MLSVAGTRRGARPRGSVGITADEPSARMTRPRALRLALAAALAGILGAAALASTQVREFLKATPIFQRLNSPTVRSLDSRIFNLRYALLSPAELGDGGPVQRIMLLDPMGLGRDSAGNTYVTDRGAAGPGRVVWRLGRDGTAKIIAGTGRRGPAPAGRPARESSLGSPQGLCMDPAGRVYFADSYNHVVLRIESDGILSRIAGTGSPGDGGDGGPATAAGLNQPYDVRLDGNGNLYVADYGNHRIRKITPDGIMHTVAGTGVPGYSGDGGLAGKARLNGPYGVHPIPELGFLIADSQNHVIRLVDGHGYITTLAGTGRPGFAGDGGAAKRASFDSPQGLYVSGSGQIVVGDEHNHAIRIIEPNGTVRHLVGTGKPGFSPDGTPASEAALSDPENMIVAGDGAVTFTEAGSGRIRRIGPDGRLMTIAGSSR